MKTSFSKILLSFSLILSVSLSAHAYDYLRNGICYDIVDSELATAAVSGYTNELNGEEIIPEIVKINGKTYTVAFLKENAFAFAKSLTGVKLPNTITSISGSAFMYCSELKTVTLPDAVTEICDNAFEGCSNLASVTLPATVKTIGKSAFMSCYELVSLNIPASVTSIGEDFVSGCKKLESITVAEKNLNYTSVDGVLYNKDVTELIVCPAGSLKKDFRIPETVRSVLTGSFRNVINLNSLMIPASVNQISDSAIMGCQNLVSIAVADDNSVYASDDGILYDKNKTLLILCPQAKTNVIIPATVITIGNSAFSFCGAITSLNIPESVTSIGTWAFSGCSNLAAVTIPGSVTAIGDGAFNNCSSLTEIKIPESVTAINGSTFSFCANLKTLSIPESVTTIGDFAISDCRSLTNITIPSAVTSIGMGAFNNCSSFSEIELPGKITTISDRLFYGCSGLTKVEIPSSVTSISRDAFSGCSSLKTVTIPNSVTGIGNNAFAYCSALTELRIPESVVTIGNWAFTGVKFSSVYCEWSTPISCDEAVFSDYNATLYVPKGYTPAYKSVTPWSGFANVAEYDYSGISETEAPNISILVKDGVITVDGLGEGETITVYDLQGHIVYTGNAATTDRLTKGIYIVRSSSTSVKITVK